MAEFPKQVGEIRPFIGRRYYFEPRWNIAANELARFLNVVSEQTGRTNLSGPLELPNGVDPDLARHFRVEEH